MTVCRLFVLASILLGPGFAQRVGAPTDDLDKLSVDELFTLQVTLGRAQGAAAIQGPRGGVRTHRGDIKRSGATSIPEALQWVPGLTVLRLDGRSWVVSARGNARLYADKILAINIITKRAKSTNGAVVSAAAGNELRGETEARWGAAPSDRLAYRMWGKIEYRAPAHDSPGIFYFNNAGIYTDPSIKNLDMATGRFGFRLKARWTKRINGCCRVTYTKPIARTPLPARS